MLFRALDVGSSYGATIGRLAAGLSVGPIGARPAERLALYEFEACPYCRKVREALSILDLDADIYPCPRRGTRFRPDVIRRGGKALFPFLVDPNTGMEMYESDDIVRYLFDTYGDGEVPTLLSLGPVTDLTSMIASLARPGFGAFSGGSRPPDESLELYSFEASPYCRIVRERLCALEIPYVLRNVAKNSPKREAFAARAGRVQVPFLIDPNSGAEMFESDAIVRYLDETYGPR